MSPGIAIRHSFLLAYRLRNNMTLTLYQPQIDHGSKDQTWSVRRLETGLKPLERGRLHNDFSVKVFKSSYMFWWPVTETSLEDVYQDVLQTVFNLYADVLKKIQLCHCWGHLEYQFWKERQAWASRRLENWSWGLWKYVFRTTGRLTFLSLHTRLEDQSSRLVSKTAMKTCCKQYQPSRRGRLELGLQDV